MATKSYKQGYTQIQNIFSDALKHLHEQGRPCITDDIWIGYANRSVECAYRNENGDSCAIGGLIKDEFYNSDLEGNPVTNPDVLKALAQSGYPSDQMTPIQQSCLSQIQCDMHDLLFAHGTRAEFRTELLNEAELIAEEYGLEIPVLGDK